MPAVFFLFFENLATTPSSIVSKKGINLKVGVNQQQLTN